MEIAGNPVSHSFITPECRENRTDEGAFEEAVERARVEYEAILDGRPGEPLTFHLLLTLEDKR
jgi:hypothetical protein